MPEPRAVEPILAKILVLNITDGIGVDANSTSQRWLIVLVEEVQGSAERLHDRVCVTEI
jgi:hypothetical protein